jgi:predicted enzyme related to lactoylglutathione lyase
LPVHINLENAYSIGCLEKLSACQAALDRVERLGGKTVLPPTEVPGGPKLAMFADPAGNITGLFLGKQAG